MQRERAMGSGGAERFEHGDERLSLLLLIAIWLKTYLLAVACVVKA